MNDYNNYACYTTSNSLSILYVCIIHFLCLYPIIIFLQLILLLIVIIFVGILYSILLLATYYCQILLVSVTFDSCIS